MRVVRIMGTPTSAGKHVNFLPFPVQFFHDDIDPDRTPSTGTPGEWAVTDLVSQAFCVDRDELVKCFGRVRAWKSRFYMDGTYANYDTGIQTAFSFDVGDDPLLNTCTYIGGPDERFLPHARYPTLSESVADGGGNTLPHATASGSLLIEFETDSAISTVLDPSNSPLPIDLFEYDTVSPFRALYPKVYYSTVLDAFYIFPTASAIITVFTSVGDPGVDHYNIGWYAGPAEGLEPNPDSGLARTYTPASIALPYPFHVLPGFYYWPDLYVPAISNINLSLTAATTTSHYEFRNAGGLGPVYDQDTGTQLITPAPMVQD